MKLKIKDILLDLWGLGQMGQKVHYTIEQSKQEDVDDALSDIKKVVEGELDTSKATGILTERTRKNNLIIEICKSKVAKLFEVKDE